VEAWLSDYHGQRHTFFVNHQDELATHGGTLIAAFGLDISGTLFDTVELQYGMVSVMNNQGNNSTMAYQGEWQITKYGFAEPFCVACREKRRYTGHQRRKTSHE
jgi:hypothetical protein